jgi:hypothetical protein
MDWGEWMKMGEWGHGKRERGAWGLTGNEGSEGVKANEGSEGVKANVGSEGVKGNEGSEGKKEMGEVRAWKLIREWVEMGRAWRGDEGNPWGMRWVRGCMWKWGWEVKVRGKQKGIRKGGREKRKG